MSEGYKPAGANAEAIKVEKDNERFVRHLELPLARGTDEGFLSGIVNIFSRDKDFRPLPALEDKVVRAILTNNLATLRETYETFMQSPDRLTLMGIDQFVGHILAKTASGLRFRDEKYRDLSQDLQELCTFVYSTAAERDTYVEGETDEEFLARVKPVIDPILKIVEALLAKYSTDERFTADLPSLVAEIREDVAKYRAEHPKPQA